MKVFAKRLVMFFCFAFFSLIIAGCANQYGNPQVATPAIGAATGAAIGAMLNKHNRWQGAVIGGLIGGAAGYAIGAVEQRAINQAVAANKPVIYRRNTGNGGWQQVEATPESTYYNPSKHTTCHKVRTRIIENGVVKQDKTKEVCEGEKKTNEY
ncbi:MAG: glycine zipper 2TM domain-containing protein [Epsilonproteobacteria bacterium]|nr:glycine zipper 2TM domain-containing protein [Campylobacterota bacterium]